MHRQVKFDGQYYEHSEDSLRITGERSRGQCRVLHIDAAVRAMLAQASLNVDYLYSMARRDEVTLYLER